jgi:hypothetical protein
MTSTLARPPSLRQLHIEQIQRLFNEPPSLSLVATDSAQAYLDQHFAGHRYTAASIYLGVSGGPYRALPDLVQERLANARATLLVEDYHQVAVRAREIYVPGGPSLAGLEALINHCGAHLLGYYAQRLQAWWCAPLPMNKTRWGYLADDLLELLYDSPPPAGMSPARFAAVFPKAQLRPSRPNALGPALTVQTVQLQRGASTQMLPLLLISHGAGVLLFSPASGVHLLDTVAAVQALLPAYTSPLLPGAAGQWFAAPVQGDPFEALAASYLERQCLEIQRLDPRVPRSVEDYHRLLRTLTDSRRWFVPSLSPRQQWLHEHLPLWLTQAPAPVCIAYAQLLQALVVARQQSAEEGVLDGIPSLQAYAEDALARCLQKHPQAATLKPAQILLSFDHVIAAAVPVPGGFIAGEVQTVTLSLVDLALENLGGFAHTAKAIRLNGAPAPAWLTYELLKGCVSEVDIGQAYPALLKRQLIEDVAQATRRQRVYCQQVRIQLPMQALEWQVKGLHGLTPEGVARLRTALAPDAGPAAVWPLAFKASAEAPADVVANVFIIGSRHTAGGPHLLYRPLYEPPLQEYPTLAELFAAIQAPGALQDSVLTWLDPRRQSVYANGGFGEPHIRHFLAGDEFTQYAIPAPAQLSKRLLSGDPTPHLFRAMAESLVSLADRQTVSNAERRWASLKQVGWLLFGTLQPLLTGPVMLVAWLAQLVDSAAQDMAALHAGDAQARNAALLDVLVNVMVIVAHQVSPHDVHQHLDLEPAVFSALARPEPMPLPPTRVAAPARFVAPVAWANAHNALTPELMARLLVFSVKTFAEPWPSMLPGAHRQGPWQGLLQAQSHWYALVRGEQFRVSLHADQVRIISADGSRLGPWLKPLGDGRWDIDLQLRLRGGGDPRREPPAENREALEARYTQAGHQRARAQRAMDVARTLLGKPAGELQTAQRSRAEASYVQALKDKLRYSQDELQWLRRLRELAPRPRYEDELSEVLVSIILATQLLDAHGRTQLQQRNAQLRPLLNRAQDHREEHAHAELNQGMRDLAALQAQAIDWRSLEQRYLDELQQVPRVGRDKAQALSINPATRPSIADLRSLQLTTLWGLAVDVPGPRLDDEFFAGMHTTIRRALWASRSLVDLPQLHSSEAERIELLDSLDHVFALTDDRLEFWRAMEPQAFDLDNLQRLQELLATMHQEVENDLAQLLQPTAATVPKATVDRRSKIIRTRNRDLYVARLSPERSGVESAQLVDTHGQVIGSFTEADDGVWDLEKPAPAQQPDPALGSLLKNAEGLLGDVDKAIAKVEAMIGKANDPASLQELLDAQARSRTWAADAIARKLRGLDTARLAAVQQANARATETRLRAAAARLEARGLSARVQATRNRAVTQDDVAFLHSQGEVRITRQGARVALKERHDDYLQVYAVNDVHTGKPLCFAHFHYARGQGPDDHFTAAHLKSPEQERLGRQAQAHVEAQAFARMRSGQGGRVQQTLEIRRSQIGLAIARRLFFSAD